MTKNKVFIALLCLLLSISCIPMKAVNAQGAVIPKGYNKAAETQTLELYYNEKELTIAVLDKRSDYIWYSSINESDYDLSGVNELSKAGMRSIFNFAYSNLKTSKNNVSVSNSVVEKPVTKLQKIKNGISIDYEFNNLDIGLTVEMWVEGDAFNIRLPADKVTEGDKYGLVNVELLPFFGAMANSGDGYILYPDGSGAIMYNNKHKDAQKYSWNIYGERSKNMEKESAALPLYGVKKAGNAFLAVASEGEQEAAINLYPSGYMTDFNRASFEYKFRRTYDAPRSRMEKGQRKALTVNKVEKDKISQDFKVEYIFLTGNKADYSGMAEAYREYLTANDAIKRSIEKGDRIPLSLDLFMGIKEKRLLFDKYVSMTTFGQGQKILGEFYAAGVKDIQTNLTGWTEKGYGMYPIILPPSKELGGKKGLENLVGYANKNSTKVYLQTNFVDALEENGGFSSRKDVVYGPDGFVLLDKLKNHYLLNPSVAFTKFIKKFLPQVKNYGISGINFEQFGSFLYNDKNVSNTVTRRQTAEYFGKFMREAEKNFGGSAAINGNAYALKYSDTLSRIPVEDSGYLITDEAVPFYQMVVHGAVKYTSSPGNLFHDPERQKLKWVEYGCMPYFELTHESSQLLKNTEYNQLFTSCYTDWIKTAAGIYSEFNERLLGVWAQQMKKHTKLMEGVYSMTYEDGTTVYVNYNETNAIIDGKTVKALDYLVVDRKGGVK